MLVGCGMVDDFRAVGAENLLHAIGVPHRGNEHFQVQFRIFPHQLLLDVIGIVLVNVQDDQLPGLVLRNLPAQLAADGTAPACHHHHFAAHISHDFVYIDLNGFPAQQILYLHLLELGDGHIAVEQLVSPGDGPELAACLLADVQNLLPHLAVGGRDGEDNLVNPVFLHRVHNPVPSPNDGNPPQKLPMAARLVIDDAPHPQVDVLAHLDFLQNHVRRRSCANHHHIDPGGRAEHAVPL